MADEATEVPTDDASSVAAVSTEVSPTETAEVEVEELWEPTELDLEKIQRVIEDQPDAEEKELHLGIFKFNFKKLMKTLVNLRDSTLSTARAKEIFETSDDDEIVKVREEIAEKAAEIAELRAPIDEKITKLREQYDRKMAEFKAELSDAVGTREDDLEDLRNETLKALAMDQSSGISPEDAIEESKALIAKIRKMELDDSWTHTVQKKTAKGLVEKKEPIYSFTKNDVPSFVDVVGKEAMEIYFDGVKSKSSGGTRKFAYLAWASIDGGPKMEQATMTQIKSALGLSSSDDTYKSITKYLAEVCPGKDLGQLPTDAPTTFQVPGKLGKMHSITVQGRSEK